jgi:hypothetical protein
MKITGFCPIIVTQDSESIMKVFEDLGFERRHTKTDIEGGANTNFNMKDANGNRINIASSQTIVGRCSHIQIRLEREVLLTEDIMAEDTLLARHLIAIVFQ